MLLSFLRSICVSVEMGGNKFPSACGVLASGSWPAVTVGYVPTVFVCWGVGLVCRAVCLMAFCVLYICYWLAMFL